MNLSLQSPNMSKNAKNHFSATNWYPRVFNKRTLCLALDLKGKGGRIQYKSLRRYYLTDDVLEELNLKPEDYNKLMNFSFRQCEKIIELFDLSPDDFKEHPDS